MIVQKVDGKWIPFTGTNVPLTKMVSTVRITTSYADGRVETNEVACEPYAVEVYVSANNALKLWSDEELAGVGLKRAIPMDVPEGKYAVNVSYVEGEDGLVRAEGTLEDIPEPTEPTPLEKLANAGLTLDDFRSLIEAAQS